MDNSKIINIVDPQAGKIEEVTNPGVTKEEEPTRITEMQKLGLGKYKSLKEAATTSEFPTQLRLGLKQILFTAYNSTPGTSQEWLQMTTSDKPAEDYLEMNSLGVMPIVPENAPYPSLSFATDRAVRIANNKRGAILPISRELLIYDKSNQIRLYASDLGVAMKNTVEADAYNVLTTAGSYTRTTAAGDNDIGNNTAATTFAADGLETAFSTLRTMKDRKSGRYLGINPNLLIVTPRLEWAAKQLLLSPVLSRAGRGSTGAPQQEVYGTGGANPFRGVITQIIVSPWLGSSYQWVLMEKGRPVIFQEVEPLELLTADVARDVTNEGYFTYDVIRYRVSHIYGVGMINDRFSYYSSSTTAPVVA